jgi:hypothetical protein
MGAVVKMAKVAKMAKMSDIRRGAIFTVLPGSWSEQPEPATPGNAFFLG